MKGSSCKLTALLLTMLAVTPCVCENNQGDSSGVCTDHSTDEVAALQVHMSSSKRATKLDTAMPATEETAAVPTLVGVHIKIIGGVTADRTFLSTTLDGDNVDLQSEDDGSGRQQWVFVPGPAGADWYNIVVMGGVSNMRRFLSVKTKLFGPPNVDMHTSDDGSGKQRWTVTKLGSYYQIKVAGGVSGDNLIMSTTRSGDSVDLHTEDDGSGRQQWLINTIEIPCSTGPYNIRVNAGVSTYRSYLSAYPVGGDVELWDEDDGSGRQKWNLIPGPEGTAWYNIQVFDGVLGDRVFLSARERLFGAPNVDLYHEDDGSGRQRWTIEKKGLRYYYIKIFGGISSANVFLSSTSDGKNVDLHTEDDLSGRQQWVIPGFESYLETMCTTTTTTTTVATTTVATTTVATTTTTTTIMTTTVTTTTATTTTTTTQCVGDPADYEYTNVGGGQCLDKNGETLPGWDPRSIGYLEPEGQTSLEDCETACSKMCNCGAFQFNFNLCWLYGKKETPYVSANIYANGQYDCYVKRLK